MQFSVADQRPPIATKFKTLWKYYLLQTALATCVLLVILLVFGKEKMVITSAIGASTFIVFAMPQSHTAKTRNVIGGHLLGLATGWLCHFTGLPYYLNYPLAVGTAMLLMVALDVEHAPAAGTALAMAINEISAGVFVTLMTTMLVLTQCRYYLRRHLKNLL